jgi:hypothetical protein
MKSKVIFLIDAIGAFISIVFLGLLYLFEACFGMPKNILLYFIGIAFLLFLFSSIIYKTNPINWRFYLKCLAILNVSYCLFTIFHLVHNLSLLTIYGYIYFILEVLIIIALSTYEFIYSNFKQE